MTTFLSKEVREGLEAARLASLRKASRLRVQVGDDIHPVLTLWKNGFSVEAAVAPHLRGLVDLYDGANHLYQCLIVASEAEAAVKGSGRSTAGRPGQRGGNVKRRKR